MSNTEEIIKLEEALRQAELGPDPQFFETHFADEVLMDGKRMKTKIVEAHQANGKHKFTRVDMSDFDIIDHGNTVVVTCRGIYEGPHWSGEMKFMRVWAKKSNTWQVIAAATLQ